MIEDVAELEFRDGKRWVPKHLALMMADLETFRYTYDEARRLANGAAVQRHVDNKLDSVIADHFKRMR